MNKIFTTIVFLLLVAGLHGQDKQINGQITEETGAGFPGVYIVVEGTTLGVTSNDDGFYEITVPKETKKLDFLYMGYKKQSIEIAGQSVINVVLKEDVTKLEEVKIQGFATATTLARRRIENMQTTPEAIAAMNSVEIDNAGIASIPDFLTTVPNASFISSQNIGTNSLTVRGITQLRNSEAPVAIIIDGVNVPNPSGLDQEMFDIEQIELIKGPQGALYGRNAIGGALNITTKRPTNSYSHFLKLGYANGNTYNTMIGSSGPIIKNKLLYRIAMSSKNSDGLIENDYLNKKVDFYENKSARAQLIFNVTKNFSADLITNFTKTDGGATYYTIGHSDFLENSGGANGRTEAISADATHVNPIADELGEGNRTVADVSLRLNIALPFGRLTATTAYSEIGYDYHGDLDFSPLRELFQDQKLDSKGISQEIRLSSNTDNNFSWVAGTSYQIAERKLNTLGTLSSAGIFAGVFGMEETDLEHEIIHTFLDAQEKNTNTTLAFFGQASYKFGKKTELAVGLRYDMDTREQTNLVDNTVRNKKFNQVQPKFSISHQLSPRIFSFASYSIGYRSGGFNAPTVKDYPELYDAESTNNYEIGVKTNWLNNRIIANFGAFFINFDNTQIYLVEINGGGQIIVNLGQTQNLGFEIDLKFRITKNLDLYASAGIIDPKIIKVGSSIPDILGATFDGNYSPLVNRNNTKIALQYSIPLGAKNMIVLRGEHEHRGELYWHPDNNDVQPATEFVNLRAYFKHKAKLEWKLGIYVNNLLETDYSGEYVAVEYSGAAFGDLKWPGKPRTFGINFSMKF